MHKEDIRKVRILLEGNFHERKNEYNIPLERYALCEQNEITELLDKILEKARVK